jgi:hypothetical protein
LGRRVSDEKRDNDGIKKVDRTERVSLSMEAEFNSVGMAPEEDDDGANLIAYKRQSLTYKL